MTSHSCNLLKTCTTFYSNCCWKRSISFFSKGKPNKATHLDNDRDDGEEPPGSTWGPKEEKNSSMHGKTTEFDVFLNEPIPEYFQGKHLPDPVRNTEREYFQTHQNPNWEGHKYGAFDSRFFSKKHGFKKETLAWLYWDMNIDDHEEVNLWRRSLNWRMLKENQRYIEERVHALGHELAAAHFIVARGGAVKFVGRDHWFVKDSNGNYTLPRYQVDNLKVEAVDASNTDLTYVAFDVIGSLSDVRYMRFRNCRFIDDWSLACLQRLKNSLEFLDIENCEIVTDNGLSALSCLKKLRGLRLQNLPSVKHIGLITLQLEELLPGLTIVGVNDDQLKPPLWDHRGECRLVRALLGHFDEETDPDTFAKAEEIPIENCEDNSYMYKRLVLKAD